MNEKAAELAALRAESEAAIKQKDIDIATATQHLEQEQQRSRDLMLLNAQLKQKIGTMDDELSGLTPRSWKTNGSSAKRKRNSSPMASLSGKESHPLLSSNERGETINFFLVLSRKWCRSGRGRIRVKSGASLIGSRIHDNQ